jgi:hypothetical protein
METWMIIAIGVAAVAAILVIAGLFIAARQRRNARQTTQLREGFGPEYARAVEDQGRSGAEEDLLKRQERAGLFPVRTLSAIETTRYNESWRATQAQFVDDPGAALTAADHLVAEVVVARGYPAAEFEQGASSLSVDHPRAVQEYRAAHEVVLKNQRNAVPTDELRAAMAQYHAVFDELVDGANAAPLVRAG